MPDIFSAKQTDIYEIRVKGHLDRRRISAFEQLTLTHQPDGQTLICGPLPDQAALYGLLNRLRDLGIPLLAVNCLSAQKSGQSSSQTPNMST